MRYGQRIITKPREINTETPPVKTHDRDPSEQRIRQKTEKL